MITDRLFVDHRAVSFAEDEWSPKVTRALEWGRETTCERHVGECSAARQARGSLLPAPGLQLHRDRVAVRHPSTASLFRANHLATQALATPELSLDASRLRAVR